MLTDPLLKLIPAGPVILAPLQVSVPPPTCTPATREDVTFVPEFRVMSPPSSSTNPSIVVPEKVEELFAKTVDVARKWKDTADRMANDYGFVEWHIRSVDIYKGYESEHIKDYEDFE